MATEDGMWKLQNDGYLNIGGDPNCVIYHPNLNILVVLSKKSESIIVDINSGSVLRKCVLSEENNQILATYLPSCDKVLILDSKTVGVRSDYNGVLLIDTMLQAPLKNKFHTVKIEILISEAILLQQTLKSNQLTNCEFLNEVLEELERKIEAGQAEPKKGAKAQKWNIICIEVKHAALKSVCSSLVCELKRRHRHVPALAIASALNERLNCLYPTVFSLDAQPSDHRNLMFSEAARRETFSKWPHMDYKWALPDQMAQAGFYHQPNATGDDRAMCFTCIVCLVCWEPSDEPWAEHERHSPTCPFVKGEYTQNVPLSVTYATAPASTVNHEISLDNNLTDISSLPGILPICSKHGFVTLFDFSRQLKVENEFSVNRICEEYNLHQCDPKLTCAALVANQQHCTKSLKLPKEVNLNQPQSDLSEPVPRPSLILGTQLKTTANTLHSLKQKVTADNSTILTDCEMSTISEIKTTFTCLLVVDFHYQPFPSETTSTKQQPPGSKNISGTGTSTASVNVKWDSVGKNVYQQNSSLIDDMIDDMISVTFNNPMPDGFIALDSMMDTMEPLPIPTTDFNEPSTSSSSNNGKNEISKSVLKNELISLLETSDLSVTTAKKLRLLIESKFNCDLSHRITEIDHILMSHLNKMEKKETKSSPISVFSSLQSNSDLLFPPVISSEVVNNQDFSVVPMSISSMVYKKNNLMTATDFRSAFEKSNKQSDSEDKTEPGTSSSSANLKHKPEIIQIVVIPTESPDLFVSAIHPLHDLEHVLVVLSDGSLLLYSLNHNNEVITLSETPVRRLKFETKEEGVQKLILLPQDQMCHVMAYITHNGNLGVMDILKLQVLSTLEANEDQFVAVAYCNSLERVCVSTNTGCLKFFALRDEDDFRQRDEICSSPIKRKLNNSGPSSGNYCDDLIVNRPKYGLPELKAMHELTLFENLSPSYTATVPACWTELLMLQKQRRYGQHVTLEDLHIRSWRLQNDLTTWDEHMFELSLPKNTNVFRVDVKLTLHTPCPQVPPLQVTLLRPITSRAPFQTNNYTPTTPIDTGVDFSIPNDEGAQKKANPVTSEYYPNTEILCGPINISSCLDLSDQSCTVAFSSPKLLKTNNRQLIVHIKALNFAFNKNSTSSHKAKNKDKELSNSSKNNLIKSASSNDYKNFLFGASTSASSKKNESFIGCDWIHEVSINIRKSKATEIPNERLERTTLIDSQQVVEKLLKTVIKSSDPIVQSIALDILIWIGTIRLGRLRCTQSDMLDQQFTFLKTVESHLGDFAHTCFILGGRSIARKCAKFLIICSDGMKNATDSSKVQFDVNLLKVFVDLLPYICMSWSAGSVRWFFQMLANVMTLDTNATAPQRCLDILNAIGAQLIARQNPYHLILRTRFGLHGTPLEPELFEYEPSMPSKFQSVPLSYASVDGNYGPWSFVHTTAGPFTHNANSDPINNNNTNGQTNVSSSTSSPQTQVPWVGLSSEPLDLRELLIPQSSDSKNSCRVKGITANHYMKGLLEVEPLHFTCDAMSDGTKLEKLDPQPSTPHFNFYSGGQVPTSSKANATEDKRDSTWDEDSEKKIITITIDSDSDSTDQVKVKEDKDKNGANNIEWYVNQQKITSVDFFKTYSELSDQVDATPEVEMTPMDVPNDTTATNQFSKPFDISSSNESNPSPYPYNISWSHLLVPPSQHVMVVERMHSGARRFIDLDFGRPVLLTDVLIPACSELLSLSLEVWLHSKEQMVRLVVASDIATKNLILSDIQPPPVCRYLKITTIGRYGMSTAKCKIPVGSYYGHTLILPGEDYADNNKTSTSETSVKKQLQLLSSLYEDIYCRYSLCCTKLKENMAPLLLSETPNVVHMHKYFNRKKDNNLFLVEPKDKIISCYKECVTYQHQLNIVKSVIRRLAPPVVTKNDPLVVAGSSDKLRLIGECLLDCLLYYVYEIGPVPKPPPSLIQKFDEGMCSRLFHAFCVTEDIRLQVSTASLLVATCGPQPWWGRFLTQTFCQLYSSQQNLIFPQDRILMLFSWLGRKNLAICTSVVDSLMHALLTHLAPLAQRQNSTPSPGFLRANTDLSLITWILLFLSQCLDSTCSNVSSESNKSLGTRWDFMCGELAMQKQKHKPKAHSSSSRSGRNRRLTKKLMHQACSKTIIVCNDHGEVYKTHSKDSEKPPKSSSSSGGSNQQSSSNTSSNGGSSSSKVSECLVTPLISLPRHHCLPCAKAMLSFILHLDYTCNVDTFLIACKDLSRVITSTRPTLCLNELMTEAELLHLVRLAVWSDQHRAVWGGPWTVHAVTCLLLDMLDGTKITDTNKPVPMDTSSSNDVEDALSASCSQSCSSPNQSTQSPSSTVAYASMSSASLDTSASPMGMSLNSYVLPSVLESDDSDLEDFLDDILERGRILVHKVPSNVPKSSMGVISSSMSIAMDSRLEYAGIDNSAEVTLKRLTAQSAYNLPISINSPISSSVESAPLQEWDERVTSPWARDQMTMPPPSSVVMLSNCFNTLFAELNTLNGWSNIEQILELWLTLNGSGTKPSTEDSSRMFNTPFVPLISLSANSVTTLIQALTMRPNVSLRTWCLAFETLNIATNTPTNSSDSSCFDIASSLIGISRVIINEPNFIKMMYTFLSNSQLKTNQLAGPSVCSAFHQFLVRLQARCDIISFASELGNQLKEHLLTLLYLLVQNKGPLSSQSGPLDAQCEFIQHLLHLHFSSSHLPTAMSILESTGMLLYSYVTSLDTVKCLSMTDTSTNNPLSCFHGAWSSLLQNASSSDKKLLKIPTHQTLIINLLRFANKLVQIPQENENSSSPSVTSQTDEHKVEHNMFSTPSVQITCLADVVLKHKTTMEHLFSSLANCSCSSFAMILSSANNLSFTDNVEPTSVGDAVFQILYTLTSKASTKCLALTSMLQYLASWNNSSRGVFQLSEPFIWLLIKSLNSDEAIEELLAQDGVTIVCKGLIQSHALVVNPHPSQVSVLMQHLSQFPPYNFVGAVSTSKKVSLPTDSWLYPPKLINFAPLGTISTISTTSSAPQPPDALIQPSPPHRRARSPAWAYHFMAHEQSVELNITLPCAILLKEVQLQPHVSALCTCPSAVALEVSHGIGTGMVPVAPPMETSGLTFIRLNLPQPEVVTSVLIRLYRAKDSNSLGLTQIRIIGSTSFGDTAFQLNNSDIPDEQKLTKSCIGWLRILNHIISVPNPESPLLKQILEAASSQSLLLDTCASLLLLPAPPPSLFTPALEHVLLNIGLYSKDLGLKLLNILLHNGAVTFVEGTLPLSKNSTSTLDSVVELIHLLCTTQDAFTLNRLNLLLSWLESVAEACLEQDSQIPPPSTYVHCASVVLWSLYEQTTSSNSYDLQSLASDQLFSKLYEWTVKLNNDSALKTAIDNVLCSMCAIRPQLFPALLKKMGILIPVTIDETLQHASVSDDRKDLDGLTDDSKELHGREWYDGHSLCDLRQLRISEVQLMTVAIACQSELATRQLLDSGLPNRLANAIYEFCVWSQGSPRLTDADKVTNNNHNAGSLVLNGNMVGTILKFFTALCSTSAIKDWLGSPEGSVFWFPLLNYLNQKTSESTNFGYSWELSSVIPNLEAATIKLLLHCTTVHVQNQQLLARVLCDLITQQKPGQQDTVHMSGFTRRLVLQLLLENERIPVCLNRPGSSSNGESFGSSLPHPHPSFGTGHKQQLLYLSTDTTIGDILMANIATSPDLPSMVKNCLKNKSSSESSKTESSSRDNSGQWEIQETLSATLTAGNTAKDKRLKDLKKPFKKRSLFRNSDLLLSLSPLVQSVSHEKIPGELPNGLTLSQLLFLHPPSSLHLKLSISTVSNKNGESADSSFNNTVKEDSEDNVELLNTPHLQTPLQVFSQMGGLALLAEHLPLVYPDVLHFPSLERQDSGGKSSYGEDELEADWVKLGYDFYEDIDEMNENAEVDSNSGTSKGKKVESSCSSFGSAIPPHSLTAFGLFLRLPGYADVLLKDKRKAQFLLRLVLGVTDDGEGGDIFTSPVARSLPTLPFNVLQQLLDSTPLTTDDGVLLRKVALDIGVLHLLLTCLAYLTHLPTDLSAPLPGLQYQVPSGSQKQSGPGPSCKSDDKSHLYWAKGTGFGTGSTAQNWNIEQALSRQKLEEEHVTALLRVFSSYISPTEPPDTNIPSPSLPSVLNQLIKQSCLLPAVASYLRNDSVLDMARHIPLYKGVLQLIRAMAHDTDLAQLLLPQPKDVPSTSAAGDSTSTSIYHLLCNMKSCVDIYLSRLKTNDNKSSRIKVDVKNKKVTWADQDEELIQLVEDIRTTVDLVQDLAQDADCDINHPLQSISGQNTPILKSLEERYLEIMRALQFDTYDMTVENDGSSGYKFTVSYHYEANVRSSGERCHPARMKRLAQETVTLSTALPLSYSSSVFVRCDSDRLDIMKVLITGPSDTPYANGCFEFDVYFPPEYPNSPMLINLETTGRHSVRFNPNLYNDGKVCLSILNTWHGRPEEKWNAQTSSFLQVLVSIQSLILVSEPYFNEPGYERSRGTCQGTQSSREYNANIAQATVKWAMLEQIKNPTPCFKDVIHTHFWIKRKEIVNQIKEWITDMDSQINDKRTGRAISLNTIALKRHFNFLVQELAKLKTPAGLEDLECENSVDLKMFTDTLNSDDPGDSSSLVSSTPIGSPLLSNNINEVLDLDSNDETLFVGFDGPSQYEFA